MDTETKQSFIREKARQNVQDPYGAKILWSRHAVTELIADNLTRQQVEQALQQSEIIEDYPALYRPLPDCLVLVWLASRSPAHIVVAVDVDHDRVLLVTVYRPCEKEWEDDWRTRKS